MQFLASGSSILSIAAAKTSPLVQNAAAVWSCLKRSCRWNDAPKLPRLIEQRTRGQAVRGGNRATGFAERGGNPCVAGIEGGIRPPSPIPTFPQMNGLSGFVERVGLLDVLAQSGEASGRKINFNDRKLRVIQFRPERAKSISQHYRAPRTGQCLDRDPRSQRFSVAVIITPAHLEIFETRVIAIGGPDPPQDVRSLHRQTCVKRPVINHINGSMRLARPGRIERFGRSGTASGAQEQDGGESDPLDRSRNFPDQPGTTRHPDNSPRSRCFQRMGTRTAP
jgi:hypothetical protein